MRINWFELICLEEIWIFFWLWSLFLPVDHTRVVLHDGDPSEPVSDYINANIIMVNLAFHRVFWLYTANLCLYFKSFLMSWKATSNCLKDFLPKISSLNLKPSATIPSPKRVILPPKAVCKIRWMTFGGWCFKRTPEWLSWQRKKWREERYATYSSDEIFLI